MQTRDGRPLSGMILSTVFTAIVTILGVTVAGVAVAGWANGEWPWWGMLIGVGSGCLFGYLLGAKPLWAEHGPRSRGS